MLAESIYIFILLSLSGFLFIFNTNIYIFITLVILFLPLLTTLLSINGAPFVPSSPAKVKSMIELAKIKKDTKVFDLGAGDGRVIKAAAKKGALAIGYEVSFPLLIIFWISKIFNQTKSKMIYGNFWVKDYSDADVIFAYLLPRSMKKFKKMIYPNLKPGSRIISNTFNLPGLKPLESKDGVYLYIKESK